MLIFIGESHEDSASFNFLLQALDIIKNNKFKIFLESPENKSQFTDATVIVNNLTFQLNILAIFPSEIPENILEFTPAQKIFFDKYWRERENSESQDHTSLRQYYQGLPNRKAWLEYKLNFLKAAIQKNISITAIDVEFPENYQGNQLTTRREYMLNKVLTNLQDEENGIVVSGLSHLLHTYESNGSQSGFEEMLAQRHYAGQTKFSFLHSIRHGSVYNDVMQKINNHKIYFNASTITTNVLTASNFKELGDFFFVPQVADNQMTQQTEKAEDSWFKPKQALFGGSLTATINPNSDARKIKEELSRITNELEWKFHKVSKIAYCSFDTLEEAKQIKEFLDKEGVKNVKCQKIKGSNTFSVQILQPDVTLLQGVPNLQKAISPHQAPEFS